MSTVDDAELAQWPCEDLTFREAKLTDRLELFDTLSEGIYGGHDYLPLFFERWLHDTRHHMICASAASPDGSAAAIVALDTIGLFDDGTTVVFQALRVHPAARGKRVASRFSKHLTQYVREHFPNVKRLRAVIQHHNMGSIRIHRRLGYTELHREAFGMAAIDSDHRASFHKGGGNRPSTTHNGVTVALASREKFWALLQALDESRRQALLPANMILSDWMPYEVTESNLVVMEQEEGMVFWVATTDEQGEMVGFVISQRSQRCSGTHLFNCIRCGEDLDIALWLTTVVCYHLHHGCSYLCLSYAQAFRDAISPSEEQPDHRPVPLLARLQAKLPYLDFSADYVGGSQTVQELAL
eukprot:TRINITY_DN7970_c0_g3_i1.p1 TRINITY_DN7970_c0_g3~~TRINITY_DN7970_c0_g3_i1.p1  ORF type:complete len:355 (+),score=71.82 TRINITY_DN7970_c0_g3_i1:104-1168(+)